MPTGLIEVARDGHIATVTINRPEKRNAITNEMMEDIEGIAKAFAKAVQAAEEALAASRSSKSLRQLRKELGLDG